MPGRLQPFSALRPPDSSLDVDLDARFRVLEDYQGPLYQELVATKRLLAAMQARPGLPTNSPPQDEPSEFGPPDQPGYGVEVQEGDNDQDGLEWSADEEAWVSFDIRGTFVQRTGDTGLTGNFLTTGQFGATLGLRVGNAQAASAVGAVSGVVEIFNMAGVSLGYLPLHATFTP